ncbi:MAG: tetratricopeptide repeat protein [Candidatus Wildermuthbacteria bacterium]|nr:tetratricopeptide repeat protein [Candidatus Wildermuthbacteria bacterium]
MKQGFSSSLFIPRAVVFLIVFFLPLFFLPYATNLLDFPKQMLLVLLSFIGLLGFFWASVKEKKIEIRFSPLIVFLLLLLVVQGISTLFSRYGYGSFWGIPLPTAQSFLTTFAFVVFVILVLHSLQTVRHLSRLLGVVIGAGALAGGFALLQFFAVKNPSVFGKIGLPLSFMEDNAFTLVGNMHTVAIFSAVLLPVLFTFILVAKSAYRFLLIGCAVLFLSLLVVVRSEIAWVTLLCGAVVLVVAGITMVKRNEKGEWFSVPLAAIAAILVFIFFTPSIPGISLPQVVSSPLGYASEASMIQKFYFSSPGRAIVGTGPGTFAQAYSKFKPEYINETNLWQVKFLSGVSELFDQFLSTGLTGGLAWLGLLGAGLFMGMKFVVSPSKWKILLDSSAKDEGDNDTEHNRNLLGIGVVSSFAAIAVGFILLPMNLSLLFLLYFFFALIVLFTARRYGITFAVSSFASPMIAFALTVVMIFGTIVLFTLGQRYIADAFYAKGLVSNSIDYAFAKTKKAQELNAKNDSYARDIARIALEKMAQAVQNQQIGAEEKSLTIQRLAADALNNAVLATELSPFDAINWNVRGFVSRNILSLGRNPQIEAWSLRSYERSIELDPNNPFPYVALAQSYLAQYSFAVSRGEENPPKEFLDKAHENLGIAIAKKADYSLAYTLQAVTYETQGNRKDAILQMETAKSYLPLDAGVAFQLGLLHWYDNNLKEAQQELEYARAINPRYSNARYMLGLVYDKQGEREKALQEFNAIQTLNPENEEVKKILTNLQNKKPALQGIVQQQPSLEDVAKEEDRAFSE